MPAAYLSPVPAATPPSYEKPDAGPQNCRNGMVEIESPSLIRRAERATWADALNAVCCYLQAENSQDQRAVLLLCRLSCGKKASSSAAVAGFLAVLSLYLTAISATAVRFCTPIAGRRHV
jgi:hypothetical protein